MITIEKIFEYVIPLGIVVIPFLTCGLAIYNWKKVHLKFVKIISAIVAIFCVFISMALLVLYKYCVGYMGEYDGPSAWFAFGVPGVIIEIILFVVVTGVALSIGFKKK